VGTGSEAVEAGRFSEFRLAIIDFDLPDMKGPDVIRQLRTTRPDLAVIAIPLIADLEDPKLKDLKINGFLSKPFYLPDLPQIVAQTIDLPPHLEEEIPSARSKSASTETLRTASTPPAWLLNMERADQFLSSLSFKSPAVAVLLTRGRKVWAQAGGLTPVQFQDLTRMITDYWVSERGRGSIIKYIQLVNSTEDHMLHASVLVGDIILSQVFHANAPFRKIRQRSHRFAKMLMEIDPENRNAVTEALDAMDQEIQSEGPPRSPPATEWKPHSLSSSGDIPSLDTLDVPPPDPEVGARATIPTPVRTEPQVHQIPDDWVPNQPRPAAHLPYLDDEVHEPASAKQTATDDLPTLEAKYDLPFTAVLIPRFPEHTLVGNLASQLKEWVERLCLAWDWRADEIIVQPDYLSITVSLSPEIAPSQAVRQLNNDLTDKILQTYPQLENDLPSKRFWARSYLLTTGDRPQPERVRAFVQNTRHGQGLEA
jgi:CheY-like chemotaxis protein